MGWIKENTINFISILYKKYDTPTESKNYQRILIVSTVLLLIQTIFTYPNRGMFLGEHSFINYDHIIQNFIYYSENNIIHYPVMLFLKLASSTTIINLMFILQFIALLCILSRRVVRLSIAYTLFCSFVFYNTILTSQKEFLLTALPILSILLISPITTTKKLCSNHGIILLRSYIFFLYWGSIVWKLQHPFWTDGSMLNELSNSFMARNLFYQGVLYTHPWTSIAISYLTIAFEFLLPILLVIKRTRVVAFFIGICLHLGMVCVIKHIVTTSLSIFALYVCYIDKYFIEKILTYKNKIYSYINNIA
jgi:hypothetical protein